METNTAVKVPLKFKAKLFMAKYKIDILSGVLGISLGALGFSMGYICGKPRFFKEGLEIGYSIGDSFGQLEGLSKAMDMMDKMK